MTFDSKKIVDVKIPRETSLISRRRQVQVLVEPVSSLEQIGRSSNSFHNEALPLDVEAYASSREFDESPLFSFHALMTFAFVRGLECEAHKNALFTYSHFRSDFLTRHSLKCDYDRRHNKIKLFIDDLELFNAKCYQYKWRLLGVKEAFFRSRN